MLPVRALYDNGYLTFPDGSTPEGRMEVVVVFPEHEETPPAR